MSEVMNSQLARKIARWAAETARCVADLPSQSAREAFLGERHRALVEGVVAEGTASADAVVFADTCIGAARRIMTEILAQRAGEPQGHA
jgi:hypothetical protein